MPAFFLMIRRPPGSTLFPDTTLFRSATASGGTAGVTAVGAITAVGATTAGATTVGAGSAGAAAAASSRRRSSGPGGRSSGALAGTRRDRESTRLNSRHAHISYAGLFFNDTATTGIYTLSRHDALPICHRLGRDGRSDRGGRHHRGGRDHCGRHDRRGGFGRSGGDGFEQAPQLGPGRPVVGVLGEDAKGSGEHPSELPSRPYLVCRPFF